MSGRNSKCVVVVAGAVAALGVSWQGLAQACSPPSRPCVDVPSEGATFPANAVAFRVNDDPYRANFESDLSLRTEDGGAVVTASVKRLATGESVFSPDEPLDAGRRYILTYDNARCQTGSRRSQEFAFLATESLSFPPNVGTLSVLTDGEMEVAATRFAFVSLQLLETPESQPFRALRTFKVEVDGRRTDLSGPATLGKSPDIIIRSYCSEPGWLLGPCGGLTSVPAGRHRVKLTPHILGAPSSVGPVEAEIELSCEAPSVPSAGGDALQSGNVPSQAPVPANGGGLDQTSPQAAACSFGPGGRTNGVGGLMLAFGLIAMSTRRRQRRATLKRRVPSAH